MGMGRSEEMDELHLVFSDGSDEYIELKLQVLDHDKFVPVSYCLLALCP